MHAKYAGRDEEQCAADHWFISEESIRHRREVFSKKPFHMIPEDMGGPFYDRVEDEKFGGPKVV